jgi:hypothetical protein
VESPILIVVPLGLLATAVIFDGLGVGVDEGAHLDAPSSLSGPVTRRAGARLDQKVEP